MHYSCTYKSKSKKFLVVFVAFIFSIICSDRGVLSHEIPNDVVVRTIIKPDEDKINLLIRVPLEAMRDINFPTTGPPDMLAM